MPDNGDHRAYVEEHARVPGPARRAVGLRGRPASVRCGDGSRRTRLGSRIRAGARPPGVVVMIDLHVAAAVGAEGRG